MQYEFPATSMQSPASPQAVAVDRKGERCVDMTQATGAHSTGSVCLCEGQKCCPFYCEPTLAGIQMSNYTSADLHCAEIPPEEA